jgi:uncharacterized membrane protein SpoIIM required for sporulation
MKPSTAIRAATVALQRPSELLPAYFLAPAIPVVVRVFPVVGLAVTYLYLSTAGRLADLRAALSNTDLGPPPQNGDPAAVEAWMADVQSILEIAMTPTTLAILGVSLLLAVVAAVVLSVVATAAQLSASYARLRDERGSVAAIRGAKRHWLSVFGVRLIEAVLWVVIVGTVAGALAAAVSVSTLLGGLLALVVAPVALLALVAVRAVFAFAPVAVVVDDIGPLDAIRGGWGFVRSNPISALVYYGVSVASLFVLGSLAGALAFLGGAPLVGVVGFTVVSPFLDVTKTALYGDARGSVAPPDPPTAALGDRLRAGLRRGWRETMTFVRSAPLLHVASAGFALVGGAVGWTLAAPLAASVPSSISARLAGHNPVAATVEFGANNWTVAVSTGFAGLALAVPAAVSMFFNGAIIGALARTEEAPLELLAFVVPHGVIELPALVITGALGLHLGAVGWRTRFGTQSPLADELERAFWVCVGVGILLAVAGLIEGFVSPYYYRPFL